MKHFEARGVTEDLRFNLCDNLKEHVINFASALRSALGCLVKVRSIAIGSALKLVMLNKNIYSQELKLLTTHAWVAIPK
jgi:hypothetical protein